MRRHQLFVTGYATGGAIALVLGAAHFFLPTWGYDGLVLQTIPEIPRDHFVYLGTYAIGLFLVSVAVMSFHFAKVGGSQTARLFAALQVAFWAARVLLEVQYPSHLQIFFLSDPPVALGAISAIACVSYSAAFIACLAAWNAATVEVGAQSKGMGGFMRIGAGPVYSAVHFPNMLADLRRRFPNLKVAVSTGVGTELLPRLRIGDIRVYAGGVPTTEVELGPDFETEVLYQQSNAIYASRHHPLFGRDRFDAADTLNYPWLSLFSGQLANIRIQRYFSRLDLPAPGLALESHSVQVALKMVSDHDFIACMPVPLAGAFPEAGLRELELEAFRWSIPTGITYHRASAAFAPIVMMVQSLRGLTSAMRTDVRGT